MSAKSLIDDKDRKDLGAGILFYDGKKILLLKNAKGLWSLPGGHAKHGESPWECAKRETKEETGHDTHDFFDQIRQDNEKMIYHTFFVNSSSFPVRISDEHEDWDWIDLKKISKLKLQPKFKKNLKKILTILKKTKV